MILGIETSCDDTSVALVDMTGAILFHRVHSQENLHGTYGGVVPEVASRAHVDVLPAMVRSALQETATSPSRLQGIAVTRGPGLLGSLLTGIAFAKGMAAPLRLPLIGVDHVQAHLRACLDSMETLEGKAIGLVISGGHTHLFRIERWPDMDLLSQTVDDAAGEAFDKGAKILGLPYPGGPSIQREAAKNTLPLLALTKKKIRTENPLDFSFSGLKTAFTLTVRKTVVDERMRALLAASLQQAIIEHVMDRIERIVALESPAHLLVGGGVSANGLLRDRLDAFAKDRGIALHLSPLSLARDNALMIAQHGRERFLAGNYTPYPYESFSPYPRETTDIRVKKSVPQS
ncbi:MAG: tRNA (adenosine(37)-N6)-threonylcarbamoyltransferase complex transferase subunit TsaD [Nitrospirae bacterium]|nr:tRNA (adenosine(37)-N6)-threonylcarbamoyltransferase complex transferase subunit TsaD [Nitrospirota bacterium]